MYYEWPESISTLSRLLCEVRKEANTDSVFQKVASILGGAISVAPTSAAGVIQEVPGTKRLLKESAMTPAMPGVCVHNLGRHEALIVTISERAAKLSPFNSKETRHLFQCVAHVRRASNIFNASELCWPLLSPRSVLRTLSSSGMMSDKYPTGTPFTDTSPPMPQTDAPVVISMGPFHTKAKGKGEGASDDTSLAFDKSKNPLQRRLDLASPDAVCWGL